ncbi:MAG: IS200/IS605 family transposase [Proteobacteria bacterium]|nr:IS200/IS605 family transposase [Pseudomonadota bacterium]
MIDNSSKLPAKCYSCAKNNAAAAHKKCKFCQNVGFAESTLCDLNRGVQDLHDFVCYAFRQKLNVVEKSAAKAASKDVTTADSCRSAEIKRLVDSDKFKYKNALAVQRLNRDPDEIYLDLKYHFVWNVLYRGPVFEKSAEYFDFISDLFLTCDDMVGGYAQILWLAPDHVHLYVDTDGGESVDTIMRKLKQHSGKAIVDNFPGVLKQINHKKRLWDKAYFSETIG